MNDTPDQEGQSPQPAAPTGPAIRVLAQYVKDLSFENPSPLDWCENTEANNKN